MSGSNPTTATLSVTGAVTTPLTLTDATLAGNYTAVTVTVGGVTYTGASVYSIISKAGITYPASAKNGQLLDYLQITGSSQVVLSEGEVDPGFGGAASTDIIAYQANGVAITPELIVPGDVNGGIGGRDVTGVVNLQVATATVPTSAVTSAATPPLVVSGAVTGGTVTDTPAQIEALGTIAQKDTFLQGTAPKTYSFTGVPLLSVLTNAGLNSDIQDSYVLAAGSDGYGVVYSGAEIDSSYRAGNTAIVAYDDGTGTFPSVGGVAGSLRTTAPFDSKGGRYDSNLDTLVVANAGASAGVAGYTPVLTGYNAATSATLAADLAALTASGSTASLSPDGTSFATATATGGNIAVVTAPAAGSTTLLPLRYQAAFLQGTTNATLADTAIGSALLAANQGNDFLYTQMGSDTLVAGGGTDTLLGTANGDVLIGMSGTNTLVMGAGSEIAMTGTSTNVIYLGSGTDTVQSNASDTIIGGSGTATVYAGHGGSVYGGAGAMTVVNGGIATTVIGGAGVSSLYGGIGGGLLFAGSAGGSLLLAGTGAVTMVGAAAGDALFASNSAADVLIAGSGNESLSTAGTGSPDLIFAGSGNDYIAAGPGVNTIVAGTGAATVAIGSGAGDTLLFNRGHAGGTETVFNFRNGIDTIALTNYAATEPSSDLAAATQTGGSTTLSLSDGTRIILQGVTGLTAASVV